MRKIRQNPESSKNTTSQIMKKLVRNPKYPSKTRSGDSSGTVGSSKRKRFVDGDAGGSERSGVQVRIVNFLFFV